tara:strand:+ start:407 stop:595 length:189 start_codon:yes stop_codon:yes gene_type:complete
MNAKIVFSIIDTIDLIILNTPTTNVKGKRIITVKIDITNFKRASVSLIMFEIKLYKVLLLYI